MLGNEQAARGNADTFGLASEQGMVPFTSQATHRPSLSMASQFHPLLDEIQAHRSHQLP